MTKFKLSSIIPVDLYYHVSVICGVCPYIYDRKNQVVRISSWLEMYSFLLHGSCISLIGPLSLMAYNNNDFGQFSKDIYHILQAVNNIIKAISIGISMVLFYKNRFNFQKSSNEILRLNGLFKIEQGSEDEKTHFWLMRIVILKIGVTVILGAFHFVAFFQSYKILTWRILGIFICNVGMFTFQQYGMFYFFTAVGFICKFSKILNQKLSKIYKRYKTLTTIGRKGINMDKCCQMSDWIDEISLMYKELYELHDFLMKVYDMQIISSMISGLLNNVSFWFATYSLHYAEPFDLITYLIYVAMTGCLYLDAYLMCAVCQKSSCLWREARSIFGKFTILKSVDYRFDRSV